MNFRIFTVFTFVIFNVFSYSAANENEAVFRGIWSGKIGNSPISVCFLTYEYHSSSRNKASYYFYNKYKIPIFLKNEPFYSNNIDSIQWFEPNGNKWVFETISDTNAKGKWIPHNDNNNDTLSIQLTYVSSIDSGWDAFISTMRNSLIEVVKIDTINESCPYRTLEISDEMSECWISWFELSGKSRAVEKINNALNGYNPNNRKAFFDALESKYSQLMFTDLYLDRKRIAPFLWFGGILGVSNSHAWEYNGTPGSIVKYSYYNVKSGEEIEIGLDIIAEEQYDKLRGLLLEYINDPHGMIDYDFPESVRLDSAGFVFYNQLPYQRSNEEYEILLTFDQIMPFLSGEGKNLVAFIKENEKSGDDKCFDQ